MANKEILFCKEMNKIMNDHSDSYFDISFSEKCFNKKMSIHKVLQSLNGLSLYDSRLIKILVNPQKKVGEDANLGQILHYHIFFT